MLGLSPGSYMRETISTLTLVNLFGGIIKGLFRDIEGDAVCGKRTLAVRAGRRRAGRLLTLCVALPLVAAAALGAGVSGFRER